MRLVRVRRHGSAEPVTIDLDANGPHTHPELAPVAHTHDGGEPSSTPTPGEHEHVQYATAASVSEAFAGVDEVLEDAVLTDDPRLSDAREPTAHDHDTSHTHPELDDGAAAQAAIDAHELTPHVDPAHTHDTTHAHDASDVGAAADDHEHDTSHAHTANEVGAATAAHTHDTTHTHSAADVGAATAGHTHGASAPAAHASSHATGQSDPITPAAIGAATSGHTHGAAAPVHAELGTGTALALATNDSVGVTPTANATLTTTVPAAGHRRTVIVRQTTTTSRTITFGSGFKPSATLATGTTAARVFVLTFVSDGTNLYEASRTAALVA